MLGRLMRKGQREASIEATCREHATARGYMFVKVTSVIGFPDRMLVLPRGHVAFVELKQVGEKLTRIQKHRAGELNDLGHRVYVVDSVGAFDNLMDDLEAQWGLRRAERVDREPHWSDLNV